MSSPSSIVHYTSVEVVHILLDKALSSEDGQITLHLSSLTMMNDKGEKNYVLDKYFTDSTFKTEKKKEWDAEFYPFHLPFIFSTIPTDKDTKGKGSLPMWKMYGDNCKGAFVRFKGKTVEDFCKKHDLIFEACKYKTTKQVEELITSFNQHNTSFEKILKEACLTKHTSWKYENEWRVVHLTSQEQVKTKPTPRGIVAFIELQVPIDWIEEICLGPLADVHTSLESLSILRDKLKTKFGAQVHCNINSSKISII